jgi:L-lysine exporter family protein LysE/ArgO
MQNFCVAPFLEGCGSSAGLIIAIGAQNAFVLKQGILKNHVFVTAFICALIDALLISLGVGGFAKILSTNALLLEIARWGGVVFLGFYGFRSFRSVFTPHALKVSDQENRLSLKMTIITALALSLLNPHVYLDTVVLLGSIGAQFPDNERFFFAIGAMLTSFIWFFSLSYGSRYLAPLFQKPISWKILDFIIGCVMWLIALFLIFWNQAPNCTC